MTVETMRTKDWDVGKSKNIKDNADCVLDLADIGIPCSLKIRTFFLKYGTQDQGATDAVLVRNSLLTVIQLPSGLHPLFYNILMIFSRTHTVILGASASIYEFVSDANFHSIINGN